MYADNEFELTKDDLPDHIIYDNVDPYVPTYYKPDSPVVVVEKCKTQTSRRIPPFPHSSYLKEGKRIYKFTRRNSDNEKLEKWKEAYDILKRNQNLTDVEKRRNNENVITMIHPCLHRIKGRVDPDTDTKCRVCKKPIYTTKVLLI